MIIQHLKPDSTKIIFWAKGSSQELFIYPPTADFQKRDFLFRISLATVEAESSVFTPFPGVQRTLMLLKGEHTLMHKGYHTKRLSPFEQDTFEGDWETSSLGKATNFNLMCRSGASGIMKYLKGSQGEKTTLKIKSDLELIYLYAGKASYQGKSMESGDCLVIEKEKTSLILECEEACDFVQVSVALKP
ncbi:HutD family protein [Reichenbachiella sp.]|uniref:HutD/Ves family protein n=1 Tax=Reichenbachiella sp. TaxID=2184521 RepID=UPI003BB0C542